MKNLSTFTVVTPVLLAASLSAFAAETHTVTFRRLNGTVLLQTNAVHGANATAMAPALPAETGMTAQGWDHADWLACVTNDVTCWALYEATSGSEKSPSTSISSQSVADRDTPYTLDEYFQIYNNLAWSDEFSGTSLSAGSGKNWQINTTKDAQNQLQTYTTSGNVTVSDGTLKLTCRRESSTYITSGRIISQNKVAFLKGRCEMRAKITKAYGAFPAFWLMGTGENARWPWCGELDIMEQVNGSDWIAGTMHMPVYERSTGNQDTVSDSALTAPEDGVHWGDGFHRIGAIINEREVVWYVDDHIFQRKDIRDPKFDMYRNTSWYILLNYAFGGGWSGVTSHSDSKIADFVSENFEIDYCRIFTNTEANKTVARVAEPEGAQLTGPVKATVWRGWQMHWGKAGAYMSGLDRTELGFCKAALTEYLTRDNADIVTFLTRPQHNNGGDDVQSWMGVSGYTTLSLSPTAGMGNNAYDNDIREKLQSTVLFNKERFSQSCSAIGNLPLSDDANYTNCCAVVAELVEKDGGAKVKVVSVNVSQTNGIDYATLFSKLNQFKDERTILLFQSMDWSYHAPLRNQATASLDSAYRYLGEYKAWPTYQFAYATTNCVSATAENPAPLSVLKANGQPSGVHTNQSFCATVQFEAEPEVVIEYGQLDQSAFAKKMTVSFTGYSGTALTDFPVLMKLSTDITGFSYSDFQQSNGGDLRFADSSGTLLPHEIDTWNPNGVSTVWVKVPSLTAAATITACWGCTNGAPPEVAAKDVWDDDYVGVWHLGESALPLKESSGVSTDFSSKNNTVLFGQGGAVGGAVDFSSGTSNNSLVANDDPDLDGFDDFTVEMWTYQETYRTDSNFAALIAKRDGAYNGESFFAYQNNSGMRYPTFAFNTNSTSTARTTLAATARPEVGSWTHNAFTRNAGTGALAWYLDGASKGTGSANKATIYDGSTTLKLGGGGGQQSFPGKIDEVRISKTARSAAWVKATHDTVANDNFATYAVDGAEPPAPTGTQIDAESFAKSMDVTFSGYSGSELTNFPVLVKLSTEIEGFSYGDFTLTNGGDLRFADASGNLLTHEIDTWNESGVSTIWVKVPRLTATQTIKAYYGCTGTPQTVSSKDVWDDGYVAVWHLGESAVPMKESSETTSDFTTTNGTGIAFASQGIVGGSVDFGNGSNCSLVAPDHDLLDGFSKFTIEVWTRQDELGTNLGILSKRNSSTSEAAYYILQSGSQAPLYMATNTTTSAAWMIGPFPTVAAWNHLAYTIDTTLSSDNVRTYKNGGAPSKATKAFPNGMLSNGRDLVLGNLGKTAAYSFNGKIDEVRISNVVRSGDWIKATHDTVMDPYFATYAVAGSEPNRILTINVASGASATLNASLVTEYITNIVKIGAGTLVSSAIPDYAGEFDIQDGVFQVSNAGDCGAAGAVINVRDGASLLFKGGANTVLNGKTVNLFGEKSSVLKGKIQCDTTNNQHLGSGFTLNIFSDETIYGNGVNYQLWPTSVDLNGHELVLAASGTWLTVRLGGEIVDGGAVTFSNSTFYVESSGSKPQFSAACAATASVKLKAKAIMNCKQIVASNGWTLDCSGGTIRGNLLKWPTVTNVPVWDGPIVCTGESTIANYSSGSSVVSNTVFNAKGAFSGSGSLAVGPGWLNLHSTTNTYSGAVTVTGQSADQAATGHVGPGGGGIGLWNGATCFTNASSITFNNSARLAFMDNTVCTVGSNVVFAGGVDDVQSVSGGVYTARSTMAGFTKTGAGTLVFDSPVSVTGTGDVQAGTLKVANRVAMGSTVEEMVAPQPVFSTLAFASGTALDLSGNYGFKVANLVGSPVVTNAGVFGVTGSWTLSSTGDVLTVTGENVILGTDDISAMVAFASGATFTLADEIAFSNAVEAAGTDGLVVARARWMLGESNLLGMQLALPTPAAGISDRWSLSVGDGGTTLRLKLAPASGYAAWVAENGITGGPADKTGEIENAVRYAFDIDPQTDEIGDPPIIQVVMDGNDNPAVRSRDLAEGRSDVTFGILATEDLSDWGNAALVPMEKSSTDGLWRPAASDTPGYVYPDQMFFKYTIEVQ